MPRLLPHLRVGGWIAALALLASTASAQFSRNTANIPSGPVFNGSPTENVDFGDVDNDGDWDAIFADGGDFLDDQDRIWINQGGLQGGTLGVFLDETATRFPQIMQGGRDIEFVDLDRDGDIDIYTSNTSQHSNQSNRWWINQGGLQGGALGFYSDDMSRWVGIASPNSSVAPSLVLPSGGFVDWSCDCDFGDLDNDGDLDLIHSSYGGAFNGDAPLRIYLNDGAGSYQEFNPSGFKLSGVDILPGNPALWSEGTQQTSTFNTTGMFADVASSTLDIEIGDTDADLDLDLLHGARQEEPRFFVNRFQEKGGVLGFRDVTNAVFPPGYTSGIGHYAQELGDLDNDNDLDLYGLNWRSVFDDITAVNSGNGVYTNVTLLSGSQADDNEGDFLDYDNDGDLDLIVANFSGQEKLYRNDYAGAGFSFTKVNNLIPVDQTRSLDADAGDVDNDGKLDMFVANDNFQADWYLHNDGPTADAIAARVTNLEQAPNRAPSAAPTVVRVHVYDNAPYYINWYNTTVLKYQVNGGAFTSVPMQTSLGQVFRGEIPGNVVGSICYFVESTDHNGNTGTSSTKCYTSSGCSGSLATFCTAKPGLVCGTPSISGTGVPSATAGSGFTISASPARSCRSGILLYNQTQGTATPFEGGTLCVEAMSLRRAGSTNSKGTPPNNCDGSFAIDMNTFAQGTWVVPDCAGAPSGTPSNNPAAYLKVPGTTVHTQFWGRDSQATGSFVSNGLTYVICP